MNSELVTFKRALNMALPSGQSAFLWGARQTGKSTYLQTQYPNSLYYDLLKTDNFLRFTKQPYLLREEILAMDKKKFQDPIIIDEVQKIPPLLNEIHWLIENTSAYFILCGSSARKLRHGAANLLGGRAWRYVFFPLVYQEIPDFDLLRALQHGLIPRHYLLSNPQKALHAYVNDYLTQEIQNEGLTRNLPAFSRFFDALGFSIGEQINYSHFARDCGVDAKTIRSYFEILVDTLVGYFVLPYRKKQSRDIITKAPKFYFFDVGIANQLTKRKITDLSGEHAGQAFENYILMELIAYSHFHDKDYSIHYWRTKSGLEVDFILNNAEIAIEVKISRQVDKRDMKGLIAFCEEHTPKKALIVSQDKAPRRIDLSNGQAIFILPWATFLKQLWAGDIL
jgi:uncharacterized protein